MGRDQVLLAVELAEGVTLQVLTVAKRWPGDQEGFATKPWLTARIICVGM